MKYANYSVFSTDLHTQGINYALEHTEKLGFDAVEWIDVSLTENPRIKGTDEAKEISRKISDKGFDVACYSLLVNLEAPDQDKTVDGVYRHIEYAAIMGSPFIHHTVVPGYNYAEATKSIDEMISIVADGAEKIAKRCNEYGICCLYEPQGAYFNGVSGLRALLSEMKARGLDVGICGDTGNSMFVDVPPAEIFASFAPDIKHLHVKDYLYSQDMAKHVARSGRFIHDAKLGLGDAEVEKCLSYVKDHDRFVSFEMSASDDEMRENIAYVKSIFEKIKK